MLTSIEEQGKLTAELRETIENAETKQRLEDLYLPYKQKRRTRRRSPAKPASRRWPKPLADPQLSPEVEAANYLNGEAGFGDTKAVLDGARQILMEQFAEDATLLRPAPRVPERSRHRRRERGRWQTGRRREVSRLVRFSRAHRVDALAPRPGTAART